MIDLDIPPPFNAAWFLFLLGWIIGASLGSFGTMLAYRLPRHISILFPRSHCPSCQAVLNIRDLIPIFSWLFSYGRCQHCNAPIGTSYVLIELATAFSCAIVSALLGITPLLLIAYAAILATVVGFSLRINTKAHL